MVEELREERLKREKLEKERQRVVLADQSRRDSGFSRRSGTEKGGWDGLSGIWRDRSSDNEDPLGLRALSNGAAADGKSYPVMTGGVGWMIYLVMSGGGERVIR
ncbi:hypothetical protein LINPERHAP1_LOCUS36714 [Linum perenne]